MRSTPIANICIAKYEEKYFSDNKRIGARIAIVLVALFIGMLPELIDANPLNEPERTYVVKKGDTLAQIARDHLGSSKRYKELVDLNNLKIEKINGIDYVWLKIGKVIKLSLTEEDALQKCWDLIVERIKKVRRIDLKTAPSYPAGLRITVTGKGKAEISGENIHLTLTNLGHIKKVLQWYSLWDFATATRSAAHERAKTPEQIIEYTKVLLALAEQESSYRNLPGKDGEYGWWQMKPSTAALLDDSVDYPTAEWLLQNDPTWAATCALDHLLWGKKKSGSWEGAFTFYNGGSNNPHLMEPYAKQVMKRLEEL